MVVTVPISKQHLLLQFQCFTLLTSGYQCLHVMELQIYALSITFISRMPFECSSNSTKSTHLASTI